MNYHKRIVLDFDDTLAFHTNRDWDNSKPNVELIEKTNSLYDRGWTIDIFTARGSISCGSREEARAKYQAGIEAWLAKHGVKYHSLSFDKPLAAYYIDDKGMSPEEFIKHDIQELLGGLSGSEIYTDGKSVHKQDKNAHAVRDWYETVEGIKVPRVDRIVGETITMEYVQHDKSFFRNNTFVALGLIQEALASLKRNETPDELKFETYVDRIVGHAVLSGFDPMRYNAIRLRGLNLQRTFSHGDFGITNMLFSERGLVLIDPIPGVFGCTELDAAKFVASLYINCYPSDQIDLARRAMCAYNYIGEQDFRTLVAAEITRVHKYHPRPQFIKECFENVFR